MADERKTLQEMTSDQPEREKRDRKKLSDSAIKTVRGVGYLLET